MFLPSTMISMLSTRFRKCDACVTRTTAHSENRASRPLINFSKTNFDVPESKADKGSSSRTTSGAAYAALASATLCFWPPERVTPRSPISVRSCAAPSCSISALRQQASSTFSYLSCSKGRPNKMFSRSVVLMMNADCGT
mmetsp:Transcript_9065/g.19542  ORF Transcript_9065/g.19542 Transcript_9065/m.19542 type:complete len:140 (+) Transcript_9065:2116-2535(+)